MVILHRLRKFSLPVEDLVTIYILYIRSVLEQSAVVWNSSISKGEQLDIERLQKCALRAILKEDYIAYEDALITCNLETLKARRNKLCLTFALKCTKSDKSSHLFPLKGNAMDTRNCEKYVVTKSCTDRLSNSAIPYMQRLLNKHEKHESK